MKRAAEAVGLTAVALTPAQRGRIAAQREAALERQAVARQAQVLRVANKRSEGQ